MGSQPNLDSKSVVMSIYKCPCKIFGAPPQIRGAKNIISFTIFFATFALDTAYIRNKTSHRQNKMLVPIYNASPKSLTTFRDLWPRNGWDPLRHFDPFFEVQGHGHERKCFFSAILQSTDRKVKVKLGKPVTAQCGIMQAKERYRTFYVCERPKPGCNFRNQNTVHEWKHETIDKPKYTSKSVLLIVGPRCTLAASHDASIESCWIHRRNRQTDGRTPDRYITLSGWRGRRNTCNTLYCPNTMASCCNDTQRRWTRRSTR